MIQNWFYNEDISNKKNIVLQKNIKDTYIFFLNNTNRILTNADKSNKTIIMNRIDNNTKIYNLLNNPYTLN